MHVALSNQIPYSCQNVLYKLFPPISSFSPSFSVTPPPQADVIDNFAAKTMRPVQFWGRNPPSDRPAIVAHNVNLSVFCFPAVGNHHNINRSCTAML